MSECVCVSKCTSRTLCGEKARRGYDGRTYYMMRCCPGKRRGIILFYGLQAVDSRDAQMVMGRDGDCRGEWGRGVSWYMVKATYRSVDVADGMETGNETSEVNADCRWEIVNL